MLGATRDVLLPAGCPAHPTFSDLPTRAGIEPANTAPCLFGAAKSPMFKTCFACAVC